MQNKPEKHPLKATPEMDANEKDAVEAINRIEDWKGQEVPW